MCISHQSALEMVSLPTFNRQVPPLRDFFLLPANPHGQTLPWAVLKLGFCASSGRAWRLWAAQHFHGERPGPLGAPPLPQPLEPAASKVADSTASDPAG